MLIDSAIPLNKEDRVLVTIRVPGIMQGVMLAKVVYSLSPPSKDEPIKYGLSFEKIEFEVKRQVRNYVAANTGEKVDIYGTNRND